ncbi:VanW family protein [Phosphitispora fastidiosa]|uniref:VanW family protein n=1 Tax=Phosphitispora fastidiosa TaxID=2837202 RepID=UPI001E3522A5|nr:VanW family protein [Phosphitispora fastidiosa]MBU7008133.1 vancomycin resistance protein YoaR [Phosphitispora fastidiosa]
MTGFPKKYLLIAAFLISQGLVSILGGLAFASVPGGNIIFPGVFISGMKVGGLTADQAAALLGKNRDKLQTENIVLQYQEKTWLYSLNKLGITFDIRATVDKALLEGKSGSSIRKVLEMFRIRYSKPNFPLEYNLDEAKFNSALKEIAGEINVQPVNAAIVSERGKVRLVPEGEGISLNIAVAMEQVREAIRKSGNVPVKLQVAQAMPHIKASDLKGINRVIGAGITAFSSSDKERADNIYLAVKMLNGTIIPPGQVFSFNTMVGPRVREQGYRSAPVLVNGRLAEGTGGGVCQVATTLYEAALYSGLAIKERHPHSSPPAYIGPGLDAAVVYGEMDLKFLNNTDTPIYISAIVADGRVNVKLFGAGNPGESVQMVTENGNDDENMRSERSYVRVYRIFYNYGAEARRELVSEDYYLKGIIIK